MVSAPILHKVYVAQGYLVGGFKDWKIWVVVFMLLLWLVFRALWMKWRREKARDQQIVNPVEPEPVSKEESSEDTNDERETKKVLISKETEARLLADFENLEKTSFFLEKDMSLANMTLRLNTNARYMSYIIHKYREKDFNSYLQHLRIRYIMNRIRMDSELWDYKLSYLADMAGFQSHSKFSSVFKAIAGCTPSEYIRRIREEQEPI